MEIGQNVFRAFSNLRSRIGKKFIDQGPAVPFSDSASQLQILSGLLANQNYELRSSHHGLALAANIMFYPDQIIGIDSTCSHAALVYRTAFLTVSADLRYPFRHNRPKVEELLAVLLSVNSLRRKLAERFPAAAALSTWLSPELLRLRNASKAFHRGLPNPLETLVCLLLGASIPKELLSANDAWLTRAQMVEIDSGPDLEKKAATLASELLRAFPSAARTPIEPLLLWGLVSTSNVVGTAHDTVAQRSTGPKTAYETKLTRAVARQHSELQKQANPIFHSFEKTETVEDFEGEGERAQATDDLEQEEEALQDLRLGHVVRSNESTPGLLKGELIGEGSEVLVNHTPVLADVVHCYPEWNWKTHTYRQDWCCLTETRHRSSTTIPSARVASIRRSYRREIAEIRQQVLRLLSRRRVRNRQLEGPEIDIESVVERHADLHAGHTPPDRLYQSEKRKFRDLAIVLLFDSSLSTDGWLEGRRILDIELESIVVLAEVFQGLLDDEIAIAHFNSNTRSECRFALLKEFDQGWQQLRASVNTIEPSGYTRIGPALRHAGTLLKRSHAREKFIILVTDGKPTDYDQYEGVYGRKDVAQAIREASQARIKTFGLAIEKEAKHSLAQMFGRGHYQILPRISLLPSAMAEIFVRLIS